MTQALSSINESRVGLEKKSPGKWDLGVPSQVSSPGDAKEGRILLSLRCEEPSTGEESEHTILYPSHLAEKALL